MTIPQELIDRDCEFCRGAGSFLVEVNGRRLATTTPCRCCQQIGMAVITDAEPGDAETPWELLAGDAVVGG